MYTQLKKASLAVGHSFMLTKCQVDYRLIYHHHNHHHKRRDYRGV